MPDPYPWVLKLERSRKHLLDLTEAVGDYQQCGKNYDVIEEQHGDDLVVRVAVRQTPPPNLSTIVGDALHNARSALDALAFHLGELSLQPQALTEEQERSLGFPICSTPDAFAANTTKRGKKIDGQTGPPLGMGLLDDRYQAAIREQQPFHLFEHVAKDEGRTVASAQYELDSAVMPLARLQKLWPRT